MHMLNVTVAGLAVLFLFVLVSRLANRAGGGAGGAQAFVWVWLVIAILNGAFGVMRGGQPILIEIGAFIVIFAIPAGIAWFAAKRLGGTS